MTRTENCVHIIEDYLLFLLLPSIQSRGGGGGGGVGEGARGGVAMLGQHPECFENQQTTKKRREERGEEKRGREGEREGKLTAKKNVFGALSAGHIHLQDTYLF